MQKEVQRGFLKFCRGLSYRVLRVTHIKRQGLYVIFWVFDVKVIPFKIEFDMGSVSLDNLIEALGV